jgi:hypothetical protein
MSPLPSTRPSQAPSGSGRWFHRVRRACRLGPHYGSAPGLIFTHDTGTEWASYYFCREFLYPAPLWTQRSQGDEALQAYNDILGNRMIEAKSWSLHYGLDNKNNFDMFIYLFLYQSPPFTTGRRWNGVKHTYDQASFDPDDHSSSSRILRSLPLPHVVPVVERVLAS